MLQSGLRKALRWVVIIEALEKKRVVIRLRLWVICMDIAVVQIPSGKIGKSYAS